jgi:hypothetical protein
MMRRTPLKTGTAPMKRAAFTRGERIEAREVTKTITKVAREKKYKCKVRTCRAEFVPARPFEEWCSPECGTVLALSKLDKQREARAKSQRAADRRQKEEGMDPKKRLSLVQDLANKYAVLRDYLDGCISCDKGPHWTGGAWHGSHFKSVGSNSALRFNLLNIHKACSECNWHKGGNIINYEPRLKIKIGADRVEWLRNHPRSREFTTEYLQRLAVILRKKIKRQERRIAADAGIY